jgi:hypothetical protein
MSMKFLRDEISELMLPDLKKTYIDSKGKMRTLKGRADADPRITWVYMQEKSPIYAVRIEIDF